MTTFNVNSDEIVLLQRFRSLPDDQRRSLAAMIASLAAKQVPAIALVGNIQAIRPKAL